MRRGPVLVVAASVLCMMHSHNALAEMILNDGKVHNIASRFYDAIIVDYLTPGVYTTVNILEGAVDPLSRGIRAYSDSNVNMSGGSVGHLYARETSRAVVSGGTIDENFWAMDGAEAILLGGNVGGTFGATTGSHATMSGGQVGTSIDSSILSIHEYSYVTMSGGKVIGDLRVGQGGRLNWSGGTIGTDLYVFDDDSVLTIYGSQFAINGRPVDFGTISGFAFGDLSGLLANGDLIANVFSIDPGASIVLAPSAQVVPLPGAALLGTVGLGYSGIRLRRHRW